MEKNIPLAIDCYTKAANLGILASKVFLARYYSSKYVESRKVTPPTDESEALKIEIGKNCVKWTVFAALSGDRASQEEAGNLYLIGIPDVISKDTEKATEFYEKAAAQGSNYAECRLGQLLFHTNRSKAVEHFTKAANTGMPEAQVFLSRVCRSTGDINMSIFWLEKAHNAGFSEGTFMLAMVYYEKKEFDTALQYLAQSSSKGHPASCFTVGVMYKEGIGVEKNYDRAFKEFQSALSYTRAKFVLALCYYFGHGTSKNYLESAKLLSQVAQTHPSHAEKIEEFPVTASGAIHNLGKYCLDNLC